MNIPSDNRKYTDEEKRQLIANLDIEVAHRTRQFEVWLADWLENFTIHQEGLISRTPKQVRSMTMREFGEKYQGNVQTALRGFQKERLVAAGADAEFGEIDKSMRKRKWVEGVEAEMEKNNAKDGEPSRAVKNARTAPSPSPKKMARSSKGPGTTQRQRLVSATNKPSRTASQMTSRIPASPSPMKSRPPFSTYSSSNHRSQSRPASPTKSNLNRSTNQLSQPTSRVPSSSSFNPSLPSKTPKFPSSKATSGGVGGNDPSTMRLPRKDESMLSLNGSPLANPYEFGMGWFKGIEQAEAEAEAEDSQSSQHDATTNGKTSQKRSKNSIVIRSDPSVAFPSSLNGHPPGFDTATTSQAPTAVHSRQPSHSTPSNSLYPTARLPTTHPLYVPPGEQKTPKPPAKITRTFSALVAIPTKDGHLLEFDPLQTSPGSIDALEGITNSAKKQAKVEMSRLVQATVEKWKIG